jgi:hypothetical protein
VALLPAASTRNVIQPSGAAVVPLTVKGFTGQTADLFQAQNSAGAFTTSISAAGLLRITNGTKTADLSLTSWPHVQISRSDAGGTQSIRFDLGTSTHVGIDAGTTPLRLGYTDTAVVTRGQVVVNESLEVAPSKVILTAKGSASQTGDLFQAQDSAGVAWAKISPVGVLTLRNSAAADASRIVMNTVGNAGTITLTAGYGFQIKGGQAYNSIDISNTGDAMRLRGTVTIQGGDSFQPIAYFQTPGGTTAITMSRFGALTVNPTDPASVSSVVKGAASQTANLQEWQNSAGSVLAKVDSVGRITVPGGTTGGIDLGGIVNLRGDGILYPFTTGTASLGGDGNRFNEAHVQGLVTVGPVGARGAFLSYAALGVIPGGPAMAGVIVRAAAGQTADLQTWQDSSGFSRTSITAAGDILMDAGSSTVAAPRLIGATNVSNAGNTYRFGQKNNGTGLWYDGFQGGNGRNFLLSSYYALEIVAGSLTDIANAASETPSSTSGYGVFIRNRASGTIPAIVRGAASQTANLQEWQNSAGSVLAKVASDGTLSVPVIRDVANTGSTLTMAGSTAILTGGGGGLVPFVVRGTTGSQTVPLQSWSVGGQPLYTTIGPSGELTVGVSGNQPAATVNVTLKGSTSTATVTNKALTSNVVTLTTSASHNFAVGRSVLVAGVDATFNGTYTITAVTGTTLSYAKVNADVASTAATGTAQSTTQTADLTQWQDGLGNALAKVDMWGRVTSNGFFGLGQQRMVMDPDGLTIRFQDSANATYLTLAAAGATLNQSLDVRPNGTRALDLSPGTTQFLRYQNGASGTLGFVDKNLGQSYALQTASTVGLIIKAAASHTANLTEWQDSGGTVRMNVGATGVPRSASYNFDQNLATPNPANRSLSMGFDFTTGYFDFGQANFMFRGPIFPQTAASVGLIVRANASQTANLQEWQNSAGTAMAYMSSGANLNVVGGVTTGAAGINVASGAGLLTQGNEASTVGSYWTLVLNGQNSSQGSIFTGVSTLAHVYAPLIKPATPGLIVRGAASQTANLQEWQNSAGTALAKVTAAGGIDVTAGLAATAPFTGRNTGAGDNNTVANFLGYAQDGTTLVTRISVSGGFDGSAFRSLDRTMQIQPIGGRWNVIAPSGFWLNDAGAGIQFKSPNASLTKTIAVGNDGTFSLNVGSIADSWTINNVLFAAKVPGGGGNRTTISNFGNMAIDVTNANGGTGWGAVVPLTINHDGTNTPTGDLFTASLGSVRKFGLTKAGDVELTAAGKGIKLTSPDGLVTKTLTIDNSGALVVA